MKFCVIGVGRFGHQVALTLAENGMEVLAIDSNESTIASLSDKVTHAVCMRVNDEEDLKSIGAEEMDVVIVAMGENFAQSILITALLKQKLKAKRVITRSISQIHKDILQLVGADQVILPEQEVGRHLADELSLPFKALVRITQNFSISELAAPKWALDKTIQQIELENYNIQCIGRKNGNEIIHIGSEYIIGPDDILIIAGNNQDILKLLKSH